LLTFHPPVLEPSFNCERKNVLNNEIKFNFKNLFKEIEKKNNNLESQKVPMPSPAQLSRGLKDIWKMFHSNFYYIKVKLKEKFKIKKIHL
jgi:hypothetical protein